MIEFENLKEDAKYAIRVNPNIAEDSETVQYFGWHTDCDWVLDDLVIATWTGETFLIEADNNRDSFPKGGEPEVTVDYNDATDITNFGGTLKPSESPKRSMGINVNDIVETTQKAIHNQAITEGLTVRKLIEYAASNGMWRISTHVRFQSTLSELEEAGFKVTENEENEYTISWEL